MSNGTTAGILLAVATCIAGTDQQLADRLPETRGMRNQVLMPNQGTEADNGVKGAGGRIVGVGSRSRVTLSDFDKAINNRTAAILLVKPSRNSVEESVLPDLVKLAHNRDVPVLIDGAYAVPPKENLWHYTNELDVDGFITSGGKAICGPQTTGIVLGKTWLVEGCRFHSSPNLQIGRSTKVGKEEFAGLYAALKHFLESDLEPKPDQDKLEYMREALIDGPGVVDAIIDGSALLVTLDVNKIGISGRAIARELMRNEPRIMLRGRDEGVLMRARFLRDGEERIIVSELLRLLTNARSSLETD